MISSRLVITGSSSIIRRFTTQSTKPPTGSAKPAPPAGVNANVPGLSKKCVLPKAEPLGPGASSTGDYKVPEYYCYDKTSYAEAEIEMANFRCPQPSANRKD